LAGRVDRGVLEGVGHKPAENVARAAEKSLRHQIAAAEVRIGERRGQQFRAIGRGVALDVAELARCWNPGRAVARDDDVIAVAFQLESIGGDVDPRAVAELVAEAAE
jgi:hypothetical protein